MAKYTSTHTGAEIDNAVTAVAGKQDVINDLASIRSGALAGATAVQPGSLATVATSGNYSDLSGTPSIPTVTWRSIKVNGVEKLSDSVSTALDLAAGTNVTLSESSGVVTISATGGSAGGVSDVQVNGTSVVSGGVASITINNPPVTDVKQSLDGVTYTSVLDSGVAKLNLSSFLTAHQSIKTLDGVTLTGTGDIWTGNIVKLFEGAANSGSAATTPLSTWTTKYSKLIVFGTHQYAGNYQTIALVDIADVLAGNTKTALIAGFGWDRAIPSYLFREETSEGSGVYYLNWNGGENNGQPETFTVTLILGIPKDPVNA